MFHMADEIKPPAVSVSGTIEMVAYLLMMERIRQGPKINDESRVIPLYLECLAAVRGERRPAPPPPPAS
jgi:hypothetical protein